MCRRTDTDVHSADGSQESRTFGWSSLPHVDDIVDTMTHADPAARGLSAVGRIEAGAHADLAIYDSPVVVGRTANDIPDSRFLLELITTRQPRLVMIDGLWSACGYVLAEDDVVRSGEPL